MEEHVEHERDEGYRIRPKSEFRGRHRGNGFPLCKYPLQSPHRPTPNTPARVSYCLRACARGSNPKYLHTSPRDPASIVGDTGAHTPTTEPPLLQGRGWERTTSSGLVVADCTRIGTNATPGLVVPLQD